MQTVRWDKVPSVFQEIPKVIAAWAFGSAQGGQIAKGSDLAVATLVDSPLLFEEVTDLAGALQDVFDFENIDLVPLTNESSPILRFEAVRGRLLFWRDAEQRAAFVSLAAREYEESMAMIQRSIKQRPLIRQVA